MVALCSVTAAVAFGGAARAEGAAGPLLTEGPLTSLPGRPVAIAQGERAQSGEARLWVLGRDAVWQVTFAGDGAGTVTRTTPLPPGTDASALACGTPTPGLQGLGNEGLQSCGDATLAFVLDRAAGSMHVFQATDGGGLVEQGSVAVGTRPGAFVFANFNANDCGCDPRRDELTDVAVANQGSDDVSILMARGDGAFAPQRRIAVGAQPRDIVAGNFDSGGGNDLAVATAGVTFLGNDGSGRFARRGEVALGAPPTKLLDEGPDGWIDLNGDGYTDLLVADAQGTISVLLGRRRGLPRLASRVTLPGGAASDPVALGLVDRLGDERSHVLVGARGTGEVFDVPIGATGALGTPTRVLSGARPVAIHGRGPLTADLASDVAVGDDSGVLRLLVESPSRTVDRRQGASNVAARAGLVVWSQHVGFDRYRLRISDRSGLRYLPASTSRHQIAARVGRAADGTPVVTYRRCGAHACTPWIWSAAQDRARRLDVPVARGCVATDVAAWDDVLAFVSASGKSGRCRPGERGLWTSAHGHRHRISARAGRLGDLRGRRVTWFEGNEVFGRMRVSSLHGRPRTLGGWTADDGSAFELGLLSGRFVYWLERPDRGEQGGTLKRARVGAPGRSCQALVPREGFPEPGGPAPAGSFGRRPIAIDGAEVIYVDYHGVLATTPQPARWRRCPPF